MQVTYIYFQQIQLFSSHIELMYAICLDNSGFYGKIKVLGISIPQPLKNYLELCFSFK